MKEIKYEMQTLSSLILSPRSGQALYKDVDEFETASEVSNNKGKEVNCIYPFTNMANIKISSQGRRVLYSGEFCKRCITER